MRVGHWRRFIFMTQMWRGRGRGGGFEKRSWKKRGPWRSYPLHGNVKGDVSGEKKLSSQWENQGRCVRGKEAIQAVGKSGEMCQGKRSCPGSGKIRGDVSGGKKLSRQWENQGRCVRGKETVQAVGNSMGMCQGKRLFKEWRSLAIQELSRKMCQGQKKLSSPREYQRRCVCVCGGGGGEAVQPTEIPKEMCVGGGEGGKLSSPREYQRRCVCGGGGGGGAVQYTGIPKEMCQRKRSCPVHGNTKGDVSGEKKLSGQWGTQWRCVLAI